MTVNKQQVEALRLKLLENGYSPIRNVDKRTFMTAWPSVLITEDEIKSWTRKFSRHAATGLRVENGLCVIDFDVDNELAMADVVANVLAAHPELEQALLRWGKGSKEAWFLRCDELFSRLHTRAFVEPGKTADDATHRVEIFGGASPRQFGAFGAHTKDEKTGETLIEYEWADDLSPMTVPFADMLEVSKATLWDVIDIAEASLTALGWTVHERSSKGESSAGKVYDLTEDMIFHCNDDVTRTLEELRAAAAHEEHLRCSASWLEGPTAQRRDRCLVSLARSGHVTIWESMEGVSHHEKADEPIDYGPMIDRVGEKMQELKEKRRTKLNSGDDFEVATTKLVNGFAYCPTQKNSCVPLWSTSLDDGYQMQPFRLMMLPSCGVEKGPRGGEKRVNPVDVWMSIGNRITVEGLRMRPDKERPTFTENGKAYLNVYSPPDHNAPGGDVMTGLRFFEHLIPDAEERDWFMKWLSFKLRYPHIPGPAVVMVAHAAFGTGRGTLAELVSRLFGMGYVKQLSYEDFMGRTYQAQYNDWQAEALVLCVNESAETDGGSTYRTKQNAYEHLKELVEVRPTMRQIKMKGDRNYWAMSSTSFLVFTNHMDALPIPEHDRRMCVIRNGGSRSVGYWNEVNRWMDDPANVSALFRWLEVYDLEGYSPYAKPPTFAGKAAMIDEARSELDVAIDLSLDNMPGAVFTLNQLEKYVKLAAEHEGFDLPRPLSNLLKKVAAKRTHRVGERDGRNWRITIDGGRYAVYARSSHVAEEWTTATAADLAAEAVKNGKADGSGSNVLAAFFKNNT